MQQYDPAMKKALLSILRCGSLSTAELGRITAPVIPRTNNEAYRYGEAIRNRLLQQGLIDPSPCGNRDYRYTLNRVGRVEAFKLMEVA